MQYHLVVIRRATALVTVPAVEVRLCHRDERVGLLRTPGGTLRLGDGIGIDVRRHLAAGHRAVECPDDQLTFFDRHLDGQPQHTAVFVAPRNERPARPGPLRVMGGLRRNIADLPAALLDLRHRRIEGVLQ
jgi:hypothetical protein